MDLLSKISSPCDIKKLSIPELEQLSFEIRQEIISTISKNGGHLGAALGVVELTLALHFVFNSPVDKIIFDVGHQSHSHKILTGRRESFKTMMKQNGLSGFCNIFESEHDAFGVGHSSTSISAAIGLAKAKDLMNENGKVIAVIGDGALTAGLAFEALNNISKLNLSISNSRLIIVVNDNEMCISENEGAITNILKSEASAKSFFENFGLEYYYIKNGHDISSLVMKLSQLKNNCRAVLLHVKTQKGKGYGPAESDFERLHGVSKFDISSGKNLSEKKITFTDAFSDALIKLAREDDKIVAVTAAMKSGTGLLPFEKEFPNRFFDVGIAEQHAVTFSAGLAAGGMVPVCAIYSTFLQRAFDQVIHDVCLQNLHVIFAVDRAGFVGEYGPTHNGQFDISFLRTIPNLNILVPKDGSELQDMLYTATRVKAPCSIRYPKSSISNFEFKKTFEELEIGKSELISEGNELFVVGVGPVILDAKKAAKELGIRAEIVNARFVKPLDEKAILKGASEIGKILTLEDNALSGGFGSAIVELLEQKKVKADIVCLGAPDSFFEHATIDIQKKIAGIDYESIKKAMIDLVKSSDGGSL